MAKQVAGELYESITGQLFEIGRQLRQPNGYPFNPEVLQRWLQLAIEGKFVFGGFKFASAPFDPATFEGLGQGWSEVLEDRDERAYSFLEADLAKASFDSCLKENEILINGEEKLRRLKASKNIRWCATQFAGLWKDYQINGRDSILERAYHAKVITGFLSFFGTVLLDPSGARRVLCLYCNGDGQWHWHVFWLEFGWFADNLSASSSQV